MISGTKEIITDEIALSERAEEIDTLHEGQLVQEIVKLLKRTLRKDDNLFAIYGMTNFINKYHVVLLPCHCRTWCDNLRNKKIF